MTHLSLKTANWNAIIVQHKVLAQNSVSGSFRLLEFPPEFQVIRLVIFLLGPFSCNCYPGVGNSPQVLPSFWIRTVARALAQDLNCASGARSEPPRPLSTVAAAVQARPILSVSFSRRTPPSRAALGPSCTDSPPARSQIGVSPLFRAGAGDKVPAASPPGSHTGKALLEEEGETQASCLRCIISSWINDRNLLFKTNF